MRMLEQMRVSPVAPARTHHGIWAKGKSNDAKVQTNAGKVYVVKAPIH